VGFFLSNISLVYFVSLVVVSVSWLLLLVSLWIEPKPLSGNKK